MATAPQSCAERAASRSRHQGQASSGDWSSGCRSVVRRPRGHQREGGGELETQRPAQHPCQGTAASPCSGPLRPPGAWRAAQLPVRPSPPPVVFYLKGPVWLFRGGPTHGTTV